MQFGVPLRVNKCHTNTFSLEGCLGSSRTERPSVSRVGETFDAMAILSTHAILAKNSKKRASKAKEPNKEKEGKRNRQEEGNGESRSKHLSRSVCIAMLG